MSKDEQHILKAIEGYLANKSDHGDTLAKRLRAELMAILAKCSDGIQPLTQFEAVQSLSTYDDNNGCFTYNVPTLECHVVANEEQIVVDMALPGVPWKEGPRIFLERRADHWRAYVHSDSDDAKTLVTISDDRTIAVKVL